MKHSTGISPTQTRCGKFDHRNTDRQSALDRQVRGLPILQPMTKTDNWNDVDCGACLKTYVRATGGRRTDGTWGNNGFTDRVTDWIVR